MTEKAVVNHVMDELKQEPSFVHGQTAWAGAPLRTYGSVRTTTWESHRTKKITIRRKPMTYVRIFYTSHKVAMPSPKSIG